MDAFLARLAHACATLVGRLPWPVLRGLAGLVAATWRATGARESRVALRNIELALPGLDARGREGLHRDILRSTALQTLETLRFWTRPHRANLTLLTEAEGVGLFDAALASGRGLVVAAPHHGNWELLNQWLASRTPISILYRPPDSPVADAFLRRVRADAGTRVTQVRAEGPGVRQLFKTLKEGGVVGILPDQQPKLGDGEFAPFFGVRALTMTLLGRLAARSGATVLFGWCERIGDGPGFRLCFAPAAPGVADPDPARAVAALNAQVEAIARRDLRQYQWTYKRYTLRPPDSGEVTPYLDFDGIPR